MSDPLHPPAERLAEYVEGLLSPAERGDVDRHLAACAACREVVAETVALIAPAPAAIRGVRRLLPFRSPRIAGAVLGIGLTAAAALTLFLVPTRYFRERPPFDVLNEAYAARRPIELRFPHAPFGPMRVTRGATLSDQSPAVLEALSSIRRQLQKPNGDGQWYHADGVASLLMWEYDEAIRSLERAADVGEASPDLSIHLAAAYFERAEASDAPHDYTKAVELLTQALQREPGNATALFNRGIIFTRLKLFDSAIQDFESALKVEPDKQWADEARTRLAAAREAQGQLLKGTAGAQPPPAFRDESAFEDVLRHPERLGPAPAGADVRLLAARLVDTHGDRWLSDALGAAGAGSAGAALDTLAALARIRERVLISEYEALAARIAALRQAKLPEPLALWRDFELLYRASHSARLADCPDARPALALAASRGYRWFEVQLALEHSTCEIGANRLEAANEATVRALSVADASALPAASLRARGFHSSHLVNEARFLESFRIDVDSLSRIVDAGYPVRRAHQFFDDMMRAAEGLGRLTVARAAARSARGVAETAGYPLLAALATSKEALFADAAGEHANASLLYDLAATRLAAMPPTEDVRAYSAFVRIGGLASRGDYEGLLRLRTEIPERGNVFFEIPLLTALAALALDRDDPVTAEAHASQAAAFGATASAAPALIRREFNEVLERADVLVTLARLRRGDAPAALSAWRQHLLRAAVSVASNPSVATHGAPQQRAVAVLTVGNLLGRIGVWTETSDGIAFRWVEPRFPDLMVRVRELVFRAQQPATAGSPTGALARAIVRDTLAGLLDDARVTTVYVQAERELRWIYLALTIADPSRTFLVNPFGLPTSEADRFPAGASLLAVGGAARFRGLTLPALPGAEREVQDLATLWPSADLRLGAGVTARTVDDVMADQRLVHFAGHAVRSPAGAALVVSPDPTDMRSDARDGLWRLAPDTRIRAELVVLSACSTGAADRSDVAAPNSLAEAVLLAGARSVLATLWDVDSDTSEHFHKVFYRHYFREQSVVRAYKAALGELQRTDAGSPAWHAFVLYTRVHEG